MALPLLLVVAGAAAAPVPPETPAARLRRVYGTPDDPTGRAVFSLGEGDRLAVRSAQRTGPPSDPLQTAPRTARTVTGDFVLTVRHLAPAAPDLSPSTDTGGPQAAAGLYAAGGSGEAVAVGRRFYRLLNARGMAAPPGQSVWLEQYQADGASGSRLAEAAADRPVYLRLVRSGGRLRADTSVDGKTWGDGWAVDRVTLPDKVTVGVFLTHMVYTHCDAVFDEFNLTRPAK
jgi:hypothetical protein